MVRTINFWEILKHLKFMKSKLKKIGFILLRLIGLSQTYASACTGTWIDVYAGGSTPSYARCAYHWWSNDCFCGDIRTF
jgi:hypothetical protein